MAVKIGEMLLKAGMITQDQLDEALGVQTRHGEKIGYVLVTMGYVKEDDITHSETNRRHFGVSEQANEVIEPATAGKGTTDGVSRLVDGENFEDKSRVVGQSADNAEIDMDVIPDTLRMQ